jgi:tRNA pseudouridine13 synthase
MKDRQAITRQRISIPDVDPARALALTVDGVRVLAAERHPHKLRTGHLRGNRFTITLRGTTDGVARATAILDMLAAHGMPNPFGAQRFGARGDNAAAGRRLLDGDDRRIGRGQRRLLVSAYQAGLFNRYLERRLADGLLRTALVGDVLKKSDSGGLFIAASPLTDEQERLDAGALEVTGPMFGHKVLSPPEGTPARAREDAILDEEKIDARAFAVLGRLAEGTRRPLVVPVVEASVRAGDEPGAIVIGFVLPPGAYATVLLAEVMK